MNLIEWLSQGWVLVVAVIGGVTLIWNFLNKTVKEISEVMKRPITTLEIKIDNVVESLDALKKDSCTQKHALLTLQRKSILDSCELYLNRGWVTMDEYQTLDEQYSSYGEMGGNGFVEKMIKKVSALPIKTLEEVEKENKKKAKEKE